MKDKENAVCEETFDEPVMYKFRVEWKIFDSVGNQLENSNKVFVKKQIAKNFAKKLKKETHKDKNAIVLLRELELDQVIETY